MSVSRLVAAVAGAAVLAVGSAALAEPLPASADAASVNAGLQAMRDYNLIVLHDLTSSSEVEGRAYVGHNLSGNSSNYFISPHGLSGGAGLTVGGDVSGGTKQVNNGASLVVGGNLGGASMNGGGQVQVGGNAANVNANNASVYANGDVSNINAQNVYYGGSTSGYVNGALHAGDHTTAGLSADLATQTAAYSTELMDASDYFSTLTATNSISYSADNQQAIFDAGTGTGIAVFSIDDIYAALNGHSQLQFDLPTTYDAVIINVAGTDVSLPGGINFNAVTNLGQKVIWNFYEATTVNLGSKSWYGSVLAPNATLTTGNFIEGSVVAKDFIQNGEVHMNNFSASLMVDTLRADVPEPATWALMILGFGGVGVALRRRRALAA